MAEKIFYEFPKSKYHRERGVKVVHDPAEEKALGEDWQDKPFPQEAVKALPKPEAPPQSGPCPSCQKLADELLASHTEQAAQKAKFDESWAKQSAEKKALETQVADFVKLVNDLTVENAKLKAEVGQPASQPQGQEAPPPAPETASQAATADPENSSARSTPRTRKA